MKSLKLKLKNSVIFGFNLCKVMMRKEEINLPIGISEKNLPIGI